MIIIMERTKTRRWSRRSRSRLTYIRPAASQHVHVLHGVHGSYGSSSSGERGGGRHRGRCQGVRRPVDWDLGTNCSLVWGYLGMASLL